MIKGYSISVMIHIRIYEETEKTRAFSGSVCRMNRLSQLLRSDKVRAENGLFCQMLRLKRWAADYIYFPINVLQNSELAVYFFAKK